MVGGLGGAAFHPPAAALVYRLADHRKGLAMSTHISGGSLGFALAPLVFAPFIALHRAAVVVARRDSGAARAVVDAAAGAGDVAAGRRTSDRRWRRCGPTRAAGAALLHVVLRTLTTYSF